MKASFHVFPVLCTETFISAVNEQARRYLFNAYEPFNFDFELLVVEKDVVITTNLTNPESLPDITN